MLRGSLLLATLVFTLKAHAGFYFRQTMEVSGQDPTSNEGFFESDKLRYNFNAGTQKSAMICKENSGTTWTLNLVEKTYFELTKAQKQENAQRMAGGTAALRAQMEASQKMMAQLPPAQRAKFEAQMKKMNAAMGPANQPKAEYKKIGPGPQIVGKPTEHYEKVRGKTKVSDLYIATFSSMGMSQQQKDNLKKLSESCFPEKGIFGGAEADLPGMPLRMISYDSKGKKQSTLEVTEFETRSNPGSLFEIPSGFKKLGAN